MKPFFFIGGAVIALMWVVATLWVPVRETTALLCIDDIRDRAGLMARLRDDATPFAARLRESFSSRTGTLLEAYDPAAAPADDLVKSALYDLNEILQGESLYDDELVAGLPLSPKTRELAASSPSGTEVVFLNRYIIDDAFAGLIAPTGKRENTVVLRWSTDPGPARPGQLAPFHALHCDIAVQVEPVTYDKVIIQCSSGVGPDIIEMYGATQMIGYAEAGLLLDLTPYAKEYGFSPDLTFPQLRGNILVGDKQYRFPCNIGNQVLLYNKKIFREAGIPEPTDAMDWNEFVERIKPLTVARKDGRGYEQFALLLSKGFVQDLHLQFGGRFYSPDGTRSAFDEPESIRAMEFYLDLIQKHKITPSPTDAATLAADGGWGTNEIRWFAGGRAAVLWGARWMMVQMHQYPDMKDNVGVAFLPRAPGRERTACYCGTRGPGINVNSPNRKQALEFMKYLASDEYNRQIGLGSDGLPPNAAFAHNSENLVNPKFPWEDAAFQKKFVDAMQYATSPEISPFVDPVIVETIWNDMIDEVTNDIKTPEVALRDAAKRVNDRIQQNVLDRPDLKVLYDKAKASGNRANAIL